MLVDIEKIEKVNKNKTIDEAILRLFNEKSNKYRARDLQEFKNCFKEVEQLVSNASNFTSACVLENHTKLAGCIRSTYSKLSKILGCDLKLKYLTEQFYLCASFYLFIQLRKKAD